MSANDRFDVEAVIEPDRRERLIGGGFTGLITLRLFNGPGVVDPITGRPIHRPAVLCDLRPGEAREIAAELLVLAERAEHAEQRIGDGR